MRIKARRANQVRGRESELIVISAVTFSVLKLEIMRRLGAHNLLFSRLRTFGKGDCRKMRRFGQSIGNVRVGLRVCVCV